MSIDISDWNQNKEILSKQYEETREMCGNSVDWFFDDNARKIYDMAIDCSTRSGYVRASELYDLYKGWCLDNGIEKPIQSKYFKPNLIENVKYKNFIKWRRFTEGAYYMFDTYKLKKYYRSLVEDASSSDEEEWSD